MQRCPAGDNSEITHCTATAPAERAREIGVKIGQTSHPDIVDVHVALAAAERGLAFLHRLPQRALGCGSRGFDLAGA